jgi:hypothetical protein
MHLTRLAVTRVVGGCCCLSSEPTQPDAQLDVLSTVMDLGFGLPKVESNFCRGAADEIFPQMDCSIDVRPRSR